MISRRINDLEKDRPGAGYGIRYTAPRTRADIFVYDLGKHSISWDVFHADQKQEFENSVGAVHRAKERGIYRGVTEGPEFHSPAVTNPFFRCKAFVIDRGEGRLEDSALCLGARKGKFFKIRISFTPSTGNIAERSKELLREISKELLREIARAMKF